MFSVGFKMSVVLCGVCSSCITSKEFTVEQVVEYQWPQEKGGESLMIQEQISEYLGVKSFKRKYPDLKRRIVEAEEKAYLREKGLVTESMCDLGNYIVNVALALR
jgi:Zn-dependent alcohol dehydrogenase